jgi:hypothetical protein
MPVADHPVHPHGIRLAGYKAGCYNRTGFADGYWAKDGYDMATDEQTGVTYAVQKMVWVKHVMTTDCQIGRNPLTECSGCPWEIRK